MYPQLDPKKRTYHSFNHLFAMGKRKWLSDWKIMSVEHNKFQDINMQIQINILASQDLFSTRPLIKNRGNTIYIHLLQPFCLKILSIVLLCMDSLYYCEHYSDIMTSVPRRLSDELNAPTLLNRLVDVLNLQSLGFSLLWRELPLSGLLQSLQASVQNI